MADFTPGDIVEIKTDAGYAYVQLTHLHPSYPPVIRLFDGLHDAPVAEPGTLAQFRTTAVQAMIPLEGVLKRLALDHRVVANVHSPDMDKGFPTFRMPIRDKAGNVVYWWFWDGQGLTYAAEDEERLEAFPLRDVMSSSAFAGALKSLSRATAPPG